MKHKPPPLAQAPRSFEIELLRLEVASGYDGLFRGAPEPVIVVAAYAVATEQPPTPATTALRGVFRVTLPHERYPLVSSAVGVGVVPRARKVPRGADVVVIAAAVEDDGGDGVSRVYGSLERASEIALASVERGDDVKTLAEIGADDNAWKTPGRARVIIDGLPLESRVTQDDWVGAAAVRFGRGDGSLERRFHLASDDFVNDWTAVMVTRFL